MKKLIMMMAAAVTGMFAFGDVTPVQDGFEAAEWSIAAPWSLPEQDGAVVAPADWVTAEQTGLSIPTGFEDFGNKFLSIKTGLNAASALSLAVGQDIPTTTDQSEGLYFDSVVKFTACDGEDAVADLDGAKLAIWTKEIVDAKDEIVGTNLFVTAGKYVSGEVTQHNYDLGAIADGWHRVTIRAIKDISAAAEVNPGFVVFIDTVKKGVGKGDDIGDIELNSVASGWQGYLFPSLVQGQMVGTLAQISSVDFAGQGSVDDVIVTDAIPFDEAKDKFFAITLGENVKSVTYYVNGATQGKTITASASIPLEGASMSVRFEAAYDDTDPDTKYGRGIWTLDGEEFSGDTVGGITTSGREVVINAKDVTPRIQIGDKAYPNFKEAIAAIAEATEPVTMTLNKDVTIGVDGEGYTEAAIVADVDVTLDLAGHELKSVADDVTPETYVVECSCPNFTIVDSSNGQGKIVAIEGQGGAVYQTSGNLITKGGIYDGLVNVDEAATAEIKAGKFLKSANGEKEFTLADFVPVTSKLDDSDEDYFIVTELQTWTVTFKKDVADEEPFATAQVVDGELVEAPKENPTKDYYTFDEWNFDFTTPIKENTTILAKWNAKVYTITYLDENLEEITGVDAQYTKFTVETKSMDLYVYETEPLDGYDFSGWTTDDGTPFVKTSFETLDFETVDAAGGITLYADFSEPHNYTVSYDGNGAESGEVAPQEITVEEDVLAAENAFVKANAKFIGWNTEADGKGTAYAVGETISIAEAPGNVALYAQWESAGPARPQVIEGGSEEQKKAFDDWAAKYPAATIDPADPLTVDRFALGLAPDAKQAEIQQTVDNEVPNIDMAALVADNLSDAVAEIAKKYPNASVILAPTTIKGADTENAKFYQLKISFVPANIGQ